MKKLMSVISTLAIAFTFSGCTDIVELGDRAIVQAIGIDYDGDNYRTIVQYFSQGGSGGQNQLSSAESNVLKGTGIGKTLPDSLRNCNLLGGKSMMFSENQIIIIGEGFNKTDITPILTDMYKVYRCSADTIICAADGKAEDIINIRFKEGITSTDKFKMIIQNASKTGNTVSVSLFRAVSDLLSSTQSTSLPLLKLIESDTDVTVTNDKTKAGEKEKTVVLVGNAIAFGGKINNSTNITASQGIQLLRNLSNACTITVQTSHGAVDFELFDIGTSIKPNGENSFLISTKFTARAKSGDTKFGDEIKNVLEQVLIDRMEEGLKSSVYKYGADVISLENSLRHHDFMLYKKIQSYFLKYIKNSSYEFSVKCKLL